MNIEPHDDAWLDAWLTQAAEPIPDDGFSTRVMQQVDALAVAARAASPAACLPPKVAMNRFLAVTRRERQRHAWTTAGVLAAAGIGLLTLWTRPEPTTAAALVLASLALPWLLLRDPRF